MTRTAICLGGPYHRLLTPIDQDIGILVVPVPGRSPGEPGLSAGYRITTERICYHGQPEPYVALHWAGEPGPCSCAP